MAPVTPVGRLVASATMLIGYSIIAVPTGILSAEIGMASLQQPGACTACGMGGHAADAKHCKHCGAVLGPLGIEPSAP